MDTTSHQTHVNSAWETAAHTGVSLEMRALVLANLAIAEAQHTANLIAAVPILSTKDGAALRRLISMRLGLQED